MPSQSMPKMTVFESNGYYLCRVGYRPLLIQVDPASDFCSCPSNRLRHQICMHLIAVRAYIADKKKAVQLGLSFPKP